MPIEVIEKLCVIVEQCIELIEDEQSAKAMWNAYREAVGEECL